MRRSRYHWSVDLTYWMEKKAGALWDHVCRDGVSAGWFDEVPAFFTGLRYRQERRHPSLTR